MSRKPNLGQTVCPECKRTVPVTGDGKYLSHWEGVGLRCVKSGQPVPPAQIQPGKGAKW